MRVILTIVAVLFLAPVLWSQPNFKGSCIDYSNKGSFVQPFLENPSECRFRRRKTRTKRREQLPYIFKFNLEEVRNALLRDLDGDGECDYYSGSVMMHRFFSPEGDTSCQVRYLTSKWLGNVNGFDVTFSEFHEFGSYWFYFALPKPSLLKIDFELDEVHESDKAKDKFKMRSRLYTACEVQPSQSEECPP